MYLVTAEEMRDMDRNTIDSFGVPGRVLMENAGRGAVRVLLKSFPDIQNRNVGVIAGRGNNGGDGFVIARYLFQRGVRVKVFLLAERSAVKGDAAANLELLYKLNVPVIEIPEPSAMVSHKIAMLHQQIWVDAILGTGLNSEVKGYFKEVIRFLNESGKPVFAVDIPSGLNSDTGQPLGECIRASATATFAYAKTGHCVYPGAELTGALTVVDIGIPPFMADQVSPRQHLMNRKNMSGLLINRSPDAHKGSAGHLLVVAGSPGKSGAAAMTAVSAMRAGAGLVTAAVPVSIHSALETLAIEIMTCPLPDEGSGMLGMGAFESIMDQSSKKQCLALGPGMGQSDDARSLTAAIVQESRIPVVIDADGLNCIAGQTDILKSVEIPLVLTPHPGEMARLTGLSTAEVQKDRIACARQFAQTTGTHVVLKGAATVIAHPDGSVYINQTGNSGMASGGMGDILTGIIAGLITQGYSCESAVRLGVYMHGLTADTLSREIGPAGYLAGDLMNAIPETMARLGDDVEHLYTPEDRVQADSFSFLSV